MACCASFRWQVPLDTNLFIPFERTVYKIGIEMIVIKDHKTLTGLHHVCIEPAPIDSLLWLANQRTLNSICSLVIDGQGDVFQIEFGKPKLFDINLSYTYRDLRISLHDEHGNPVSSKGYCILQLRSVHLV